jgi:uncharacterized DUF497 family protein
MKEILVVVHTDRSGKIRIISALGVTEREDAIPRSSLILLNVLT